MEEAKSTGDASPGAGIDLGSSPALGYAPILDSIGGDGLPDNQAKVLPLPHDFTVCPCMAIDAKGDGQDEKADVSAGANDCMHAAEPSLTSAHALGETSDAESVDDELLTALGEDEVTSRMHYRHSQHARVEHADAGDGAKAGGAGNEAEDAEVFGSVGSAFDRSARRHMARVAIAKTKPTTSFEQKRPLSHIFEDLAPRAPKRSVVRAFGVGGAGSAGPAGVQANSFGDGTCLWSGLRIKDRKVAEEKLKLYFHGRHVLRLSRVSKEVPVGDWLTIGVLATKCSPRSTAKGGRFLIWGLTNLAGDRIALFLFGSAYENFWKDQGQGIVVAVLNPKPFEGRERKGGMERDEPAFSVHEEGQIKILGTAKDYGICKSLRKDGNPCNNVINAAVCQYCDVHVAGEMRKLNSTRANMHNWSGGSAPVTVAHRAKMAQARQIVNRLGGGGTKTVQQMIRAPAVTPTAVARKSRDGKTEYVPLSESLKKTSLNKMTQRARNGKPSIASAHMKVLDERVREAKAQGVPLGKFKPTGPAPQTVPRAQSLSAAPTNGRTSTTIISTIPSQAMGSNPVRAAGSVSAGGAAHTPGHRRSEKPGGRGSALVGAAITAHSKSTEGGNGTGVRMAVSSSGRVTGRGTAPSEKAVDEETSLNRERQAREPSSEDEGAREIAEQEARLQLMKECLARKKAEKELRVDGDSSVGNKVERRVRPRDHDEEQTIIYADGTSCPRALPRTPLQEHSFLPTRATGTASTPAGQSGMETPPTAELRGRGKRAGMLELSDDDSDCDSDEEQMLVVQDTTLVRPGLAQEWEKSDRPIVAQERQLAPQTIKAAGVKIPVANPNRAEPAPHAVLTRVILSYRRIGIDEHHLPVPLGNSLVDQSQLTLGGCRCRRRAP